MHKAEDKTFIACARYEKARQKIIRLTSAIGYASEGDCLNPDPEESDYGEPSCIERYWCWGRERRAHAGSDNPFEQFGIEQPSLCTRCSRIDDLVQERKQARQEFGVAKRLVALAGKQAIATLESGE